MIIPMGDRARATVKVRVKILDADTRLFPEMSSTVYFLPGETDTSAKQDESRVFCPAAAIVSIEAEAFVWILTDSDRTRKTPVTIGQTRDDRVEIVSGLSGGEKVIVNPDRELQDDMLVKTAQ